MNPDIGLLLTARWPLAAFLFFASALLAGCAEQESGTIRENVLNESIAALETIRSYEVVATGALRQDDIEAEFNLRYEFVAPDALRFVSESSIEGQLVRAGLVLLGERNWELDEGDWIEGPSVPLDATLFSAATVWGLVPFGSAVLEANSETVGGVATQRYRIERSANLSMQTLAGALLAGTEPRFRDDLTHFEISFWLDETDGWPVRLELTARGPDRSADMTVELVAVNDPSIKIEAPN